MTPASSPWRRRSKDTPTTPPPPSTGDARSSVHDGDRLITSTVAIPERLSAVLFVPEMPMPTAEARSVLPTDISVQDAVFNMGRVGLLVNALATDDLDQLAVATQDRLHQPPRQAIFHPMKVIMRAALDAGAHRRVPLRRGLHHPRPLIRPRNDHRLRDGRSGLEGGSGRGCDRHQAGSRGRAGGGVRGLRAALDAAGWPVGVSYKFADTVGIK